MTWHPSKTKAKQFAESMKKIEAYCDENGITRSASSDSYYFEHDGTRYRVSNHTVSASNRHAYNWLGEQVRDKYHPDGEDGMVCITAGKTRIIEIHKAIVSGKKLDRRGNVVDC